MMCPPCARASTKPGRHRKHACEQVGIAGTIGYVCDCVCNRPSSQFDVPSIVVDLGKRE